MSTKNTSLTTAIVKRTLRVPKRYQPLELEVSAIAQDVSRQLDVALISNGFKASQELLLYIASLHNAEATELSKEVVAAVEELVGNHVQHNTYFKDFPKNVPDTLEFWLELIQKTYGSEENAPLFINLLELDGYGKYNHSYEEMVAAHEQFEDKAPNTVKLKKLVLGGSLPEEAHKLYLSLAESAVVANGEDLELLKELAEVCASDEQPTKIPVRENRAVINSVRISLGKPIVVDTVTDVLRLAAHLSEGDVSLSTNTKFRKFNSTERHTLVQALEDVISKNAGKLGDVFKHRGKFKQLAQKLYASEYPHLKHAQEVFKVAHENINLSFESKVEKAFAKNSVSDVVELLTKNPGMFVKQFNRVLLQTKMGELDLVTKALETAMPKVTTPTLLGLRQYLSNRTEQKTKRVFMNRKGTGKAVADEQPVLNYDMLVPIVGAIDRELTSRIPKGIYVVSRDILNVALPLSNKQTAAGLGVLPRGSVSEFNADVLRFFIYWKESKHTTDFDLSALMLDEDFKQVGQLSYTGLTAVGGKHSGDITSSRHGATEFIDLEVGKVQAKYLVPQVNVYSGESFDEVEESIFGYMERNAEQKGLPFEPKTVKTKSELRIKNKVALPIIFYKEDDQWKAKWLHLGLKGYGWGNRTENNKLTTADLVSAAVETKYINVGYIVSLLENAPEVNLHYYEDLNPEEDFVDDLDVTYVGLEAPEGLPERTKVITLTNLHELL